MRTVLRRIGTAAVAATVVVVGVLSGNTQAFASAPAASHAHSASSVSTLTPPPTPPSTVVLLDGSVTPNKHVKPTAHDKKVVTTPSDYATKGFPGKKATPLSAAQEKVQKATGGTASLLTTCSGACFFYSVGSQAATPAPTGVYGLYKVNAPYVDPVHDYHSLVELAVESADTHQIIEVGITVDHALNGDYNAHLFVFHWVNGSPTCYNACGFVTYGSPSATPGQDMSSVVGTGKKLGIEYFSGNWWIAYDTGWVGYFPGSLWTGASPPVTTFTQASYYQQFWEVAAGVTTPCTDMGDGIAASAATANATSTGAAYLGNTAFSGSTATPNMYERTEPSSASPEYPTYPIPANTRSFYGGGPGWNPTGTGVGTTGGC